MVCPTLRAYLFTSQNSNSLTSWIALYIYTVYPQEISWIIGFAAYYTAIMVLLDSFYFFTGISNNIWWKLVFDAFI